MRPWVDKAFSSVVTEWHEAPWFVILTIGVTALVAPGVFYAAWLAISNLLP